MLLISVALKATSIYSKANLKYMLNFSKISKTFSQVPASDFYGWVLISYSFYKTILLYSTL